MNSDIIRLLPDSVANQIAAGEVIQRPASVIKELVENAVDAGATAITIILKDAGRTLIQVVDNGSGMSPTDARMAFERHATSKIRTADDLYSLHSMGFRGEALPSIAAVAQIDLRTMRHDDTIGTRLLLSESKFESQEPASCVPGTNLMVKNLFFHMPARLISTQAMFPTYRCSILTALRRLHRRLSTRITILLPIRLRHQRAALMFRVLRLPVCRTTGRSFTRISAESAAMPLRISKYLPMIISANSLLRAPFRSATVLSVYCRRSSLLRHPAKRHRSFRPTASI